MSLGRKVIEDALVGSVRCEGGGGQKRVTRMAVRHFMVSLKLGSTLTLRNPEEKWKVDFALVPAARLRGYGSGTNSRGFGL